MFSKRSKVAFSLCVMFCIVSPQLPRPPPWVPRDEYFTDRFHWPVWNNFYDCIVGIYVDGKPAGLGVFIRSFTIITSANIFGKWRRDKPFFRPDPLEIPPSLEVFAINGTWNKAVKLEIDQVSGNQVHRNRAWVKVGFDNRHTTVHDFIIITFIYARVQSYKVRGWFDRTPYFVPVSRPRIKPYSPYGWKFAAFGFVDKPHIEKSFQLVRADYSWEAILEDCDEWIPRPWGRFICLNNMDNYLGIQSGAPLFHENELYGLGAFELNKGNESILVFSEVKPYFDNVMFNYFITFTTPTPPWMINWT